MDGHDYDVMYKGMVIANIKAFSDKDARDICNKTWGKKCTVERTDAPAAKSVDYSIKKK
jgi:hypothetical protein